MSGAGTILVARSGRKTWPVEGYPSQTPGLAITRWVGYAIVVDDDEWAVTHLSSGFKIPTRPLTKKEAMRLATRLAPLADWTKPRRQIEAKKRNLAGDVRALVLKLRMSP